MQKNKYTINETYNNEIWDKFVESSNEGSIFSESLFLKNTTGKFIRYFVRKGNEIKAGFNLFLSEDSISSISNPHSYS